MYACPSCQSTLQTPPVGWHADLHCDHCGGVWISAKTLKSALNSWRVSALFEENSPSADFCPICGPVPLDEGTILGQEGLSCSSCRGVFMRRALRYERTPQALPRSQHRAKPKVHRRPSPPKPLISTVERPSEVLKALPRSSDKPTKKAPTAIKKETQILPSSTQKNADVKTADLLWFGGLCIFIIASLFYWMNP